MPTRRPHCLFPSSAALLLLAVGGCASLPTDYPLPSHSVAFAPDPSTRLARLEARFVERHGDGVPGCSAIDANGDAAAESPRVFDHFRNSDKVIPATGRSRGREDARPRQGAAGRRQ
jgi:hypothetical protein